MLLDLHSLEPTNAPTAAAFLFASTSTVGETITATTAANLSPTAVAILLESLDVVTTVSTVLAMPATATIGEALGSTIASTLAMPAAATIGESLDVPAAALLGMPATATVGESLAGSVISSLEMDATAAVGEALNATSTALLAMQAQATVLLGGAKVLASFPLTAAATIGESLASTATSKLALLAHSDVWWPLYPSSVVVAAASSVAILSPGNNVSDVSIRYGVPRRIAFTLMENTDTPADLTGRTVTMYAKRQARTPNAQRTQFAMNIDQQIGGQISYLMQAGDFDFFEADSTGTLAFEVSPPTVATPSGEYPEDTTIAYRVRQNG